MWIVELYQRIVGLSVERAVHEKSRRRKARGCARIVTIPAVAAGFRAGRAATILAAFDAVEMGKKQRKEKKRRPKRYQPERATCPESV